MARLEVRVLLGYRCDKPNCDTELILDEGTFFEKYEEHQREAVIYGWSVWVGRSQRHYCPDHGPAQPTSMRRVA